MNKDDVKCLRNDLGWSLAKLASVLGVSEITVRYWEQGLRRPRGCAVTLLNQLRRRADRQAKVGA